MSNEVTDDQIIRLAYQYLITWGPDTIRFARAVLALTSAPAEPVANPVADMLNDRRPMHEKIAEVRRQERPSTAILNMVVGAPPQTPQAAGAIDARERFEKWARERGHDTHRSAGTGYLVYSVQVMWMAWQAALASPQEAPPAAGAAQAVAALRDALRKIASSSGGEDGCYYTNRANIRIAAAALKADHPGERKEGE